MTVDDREEADRWKLPFRRDQRRATRTHVLQLRDGASRCRLGVPLGSVKSIPSRAFSFEPRVGRRLAATAARVRTAQRRERTGAPASRSCERGLLVEARRGRGTSPPDRVGEGLLGSIWSGHRKRRKTCAADEARRVSGAQPHAEAWGALRRELAGGRRRGICSCERLAARGAGAETSRTSRARGSRNDATGDRDAA